MKEIRLTKGYVALVDDADFERVNQHKWQAHPDHNCVYAQTSLPAINGKQPSISMHRLVLGVTDPKTQVDHINHDGLDNRRANLRACTPAENQHNSITRSDNTSGCKGVAWYKATARWVAQIQVRGKKHHIGYFTDKEAATAAYGQACRELHGEFANPEGAQ